MLVNRSSICVFHSFPFQNIYIHNHLHIYPHNSSRNETWPAGKIWEIGDFPRLNATCGLFHRLSEGHLPRQQDLRRRVAVVPPSENHRKIHPMITIVGLAFHPMIHLINKDHPSYDSQSSYHYYSWKILPSSEDPSISSHLRSPNRVSQPHESAKLQAITLRLAPQKGRSKGNWFPLLPLKAPTKSQKMLKAESQKSQTQT